MRILLNLLPIIILIFGFFIYRFNGRKELLKMDLVQFIYAFVLAPAIIIWTKTVVFFSIDNLLGITDVETKFLIDSIITTIAFFFYGFMVIHSLTKSFEIKKSRDPLFDIFEHSEYLHLWLSHIVIYSGWLVVTFVLGILNIIFPFELRENSLNPTVLVLIGFVLSLLFKHALGIVKEENFGRVMKLQVYTGTFALIVVYILIRPQYSAQFSAFWAATMFFISTAIATQDFRKRRKKQQ